MKKIVGCIIIAIYGVTFCYAQQAMSTAGGEAAGANGSVSFTVGQTNYNTFLSSSGSVMQGVQQPFDIYVVADLDPNNEITLICEAYPNPATDFLILKVIRNPLENLNYQLIDMNGKLLEEKSIEEAETNISLQHYQPATYFLKVTSNIKEIKTFKITKN
jgi:hypothetical protein